MKTRARNMHLSLSAAINPDTMEPYKTHTNSHFYQVPNRSPVCDTLCHMQFVRVLIVVVLLLLSQIDGVGHKQRQQLNKRLASELADDLSDRCSDAASKKLKGGHKQRSRSAAASSSSAATAQNVDLPFSRNLIKDWAAGRITCEQVQRYALTAEQQGANGVGELASMGAGGKHQSNIFRAMRNFLGIPAGAPGITFFEIPTTQGTRTPHPFLLPHEFFFLVEVRLIGRCTLQGRRVHALSSGIPSRIQSLSSDIQTFQKRLGSTQCHSAFMPTPERSANRTQSMFSVSTRWLAEVRLTKNVSFSLLSRSH